MNKLDPDKPRLSKEAKAQLCHTWKTSGLSKSEFARQNGIMINTFCAWCTKLWPGEKTLTKDKTPRGANDWVQITPPTTKTIPIQHPKVAPIEIKFPNGLVITMQV